MLLFALLFKILPDVKIQWKYLWWGSILTAFLFILGKTAIGFYLSKTNPGSAYGAAGSIVLILLWVSYSSMIFFTVQNLPVHMPIFSLEKFRQQKLL